MDTETDTDSDFDTRFSRYRCLFNDHSIQVTQSRLKEIKVKLKDELDVDDDCEEEKIHKLNFYTWIEYKLHNKERAGENNREVIELTESRNITSLLYHAFLLEKNGENMSADRSLNKVDVLKQGCDADLKNTEAKAELAYSYSRIGGARYISCAIDLYEEIVSKFPDEFTWKYRLGLAHRRATHGNISTTMSKWQPAIDHVEKAANYLFDVAQHSPNDCLRARAYSQLAVMRNYCTPFVGNDTNRIFLDKSVQQLIDDALENGPNDARTMAECGRILKYIDLDKAIELLEKSMGIKKHSITLHHLGGCYVRKAVLSAKCQRQRPVQWGQGRKTPVQFQQDRQTPVQFQQDRQTPVQFQQHRQTPVQWGQGRQTLVKFQQGRQTPVQFQQGRQTPAQFQQDRQAPLQREEVRQTPYFKEHDGQTPFQKKPLEYKNDQNRKTQNEFQNTHTSQKYESHNTQTHQRYEYHNKQTPQRYESHNTQTHQRYEYHKTQTHQRYDRGRNRKPQNQNGRKFHDHKFIKCPFKVNPLNREDMYVTKAIDCFKKSIQISFENNHPALYDLGLIYRSCGLYEEAVNQFNKIINGRGKGNDYFITVICAHEQCGLSLADWANTTDDNLSELEREKLQKSSEKKLLKAVGLAAGLAMLDPEIKHHAEGIWHSFRMLESRFSEENESPKIIKKFILLLQVACQYDKIPAVIEKLKSLSETELSDWRVIKAALESYLALHDYESAFTFLSVSMTTPQHIPHNYELDCLKLKVQLCTAESRLRTDAVSAKFILKPLFDSIVKSQPPEAVEVKDVQDNNDEFDDTIDVLILWDDTSPASDDLRDKVCLLQKCISEIFGLEVSVNLEKCSSTGLTLQSQIEEMNRSKLLLVLLEKHPPTKTFKFILDFIPSLGFEKTDAPRQLVLLGLVDSEARIPPILKQNSHMSLEHCLGHLSCIEFTNDSRLDESSLKDDQILRVNEKDTTKTKSITELECPMMNWSIDTVDSVTSLMQLYCSLIEKKWPL